MAQTTNVAQEGRLESTGGLTLFYRAWRPAGVPRGVVVIVHGFNSHSGYYLWTAAQFVNAGLAVYALDLRGRGKSDGERFYIDQFSEYLDDVGTLMKLVRSREPGRPIVIFGHSAGGVIASMYTLEHQAELAGLICVSFAFRVPAPDFALAVMKGLSHVAPHAHVLREHNEDFSRDPAVVDMMNSDPLIAHETQPTKTVAEMVRADERLEKAFPRFTLPLFILHGTLDKATKPSGSQLFYDRAGSRDKTLKLYDGYFHDPLNDVGKETVMADITAWIDARLPAA